MWMAALCGALCALPAGVAGAEQLPDGRVYERVSSLAQYGAEVYPPFTTGVGSQYTTLRTLLPFQAASDGNRVAYPGAPSVGGNELGGEKGGNEYMATRSPSGGWSQSNLAPAGHPSAVFQAFSADLSTGFLDAMEPLSPDAPGFGEVLQHNQNYDVLYETGTAEDDYVPYLTAKPPYRSIATFHTAGQVYRYEANPGTDGGRGSTSQLVAFAGASADSSHALFMANDALTGASEGRPAAEGGPGEPFEKEDNLYESVDGQLRLVNVLPDGSTHANATFGGPLIVDAGGTKFSHVISSDGSRIFWTDLRTGHIYVRENDAKTVEVSSAGAYQTATSDGSAVFYTNGDLYEYQLEGARTTDLTPGVPVERVIGASENGEYIYYVTNSGEFDLLHDGVTTMISPTPVTRGEVSPDGKGVVFTTRPQSFQHVEIYDADTGSLYCASCTAGGSSGNLMMTNEASVYQPRWISAEGNSVFFVSHEALVPQDANGVNDVYEWDRPGVSGCADSGGCVYLLSGGTSPEDSSFADASESGDDAFIVTRARLAAADEDELFDLYDARVNGLVPATPPACTGTGCQGLPGAPPIFATPSSVTFEGVGNFSPPAKEAAAKPKPEKKKPHKKNSKHRKSKAKKSARKARGHKRSGTKGGRS
jgi:hypothetical protein